jgi:hypothetical protein
VHQITIGGVYPFAGHFLAKNAVDLTTSADGPLACFSSDLTMYQGAQLTSVEIDIPLGGIECSSLRGTDRRLLALSFDRRRGT